MLAFQLDNNKYSEKLEDDKLGQSDFRLKATLHFDLILLRRFLLVITTGVRSKASRVEKLVHSIINKNNKSIIS